MTRTGPHRTALERERDLAEIARLYLHGVVQVEIADRLGLSQSQVSRDLKVLQNRWQESALANLSQAKALELARIDNLEREYWSAWQESRGEQQVTTTEQVSGKTERKRVGIRKQNRFGNAEYLEGIQWCILARCKILGILQPPRALGIVDYSRLSDGQLERIANGEDPLKVLMSGGDSISSSNAHGTGAGDVGVAPEAAAG